MVAVISAACDSIMNTQVLAVYSLAALAVCLAAPGGLYGGYHGPQAVPHVLPSGHLADTHEVAAAKALHYSALAKAEAHGGYGHAGYAGAYTHGGAAYSHGIAAYSGADHGAHGDYRYHGPIAVPHVLHDGHIADTHEVAAAKAEHFAAVAKARTHHHDYNGQYAAGYDHYSGASGAYHGDSGAYHGASGAYHGYAGHAAYHGPVAKPVVLPSGYLADTHEVAAAKGQHLHALAQAHHHSHDDYHH